MSNKAGKSRNRWIHHVEEYAEEHNIPYSCAISQARKTYKKPGHYTISDPDEENFNYLLSLLKEKEIKELEEKVREVDAIDNYLKRREKQGRRALISREVNRKELDKLVKARALKNKVETEIATKLHQKHLTNVVEELKQKINK